MKYLHLWIGKCIFASIVFNKFMKILVSFLLLLSYLGLQAQTAVYDRTSYNFLIHQPSIDTSNGKLPLIVFLHGRSLSGSNNLERVKRYGVFRALERGLQLPNAIVIAPQSHRKWEPDRVMELIDYVIQHYNADSSRVYVCGMSMGGYETMHVVGKYPHRIAAAVAICGGGDLNDACNLGQVPIWLMHGSIDKIVPPSESRKLYRAIKQCRDTAKVKLTIIKGGTHGSVERVFHTPEMYEWMLEHTKNK